MRQRSPPRRVATTSPTAARDASSGETQGDSSPPASPTVSPPTVATSSASGGSTTLSYSNDQQKTKIMHQPKCHQTPRFLAEEAFPDCSAARPLPGSVRIGEAYRLAATVLLSANASARFSQPVSWGYGSTDGALSRDNTTKTSLMAPLGFFRRDNVRSTAAGNRLSVFLTCTRVLAE